MSTFLVVGLGNPGKKYKDTRHNVGFKVIDAINIEHAREHNSTRFRALVSNIVINGEKVILMKPQTYMNLSGVSVKSVSDYYKIGLSHIILVYDDIDLEFGQIRVKSRGSAGTHNGMKSVVEMLSSASFPRVRVGIGKPNNIHVNLADYVLSEFPKDEKRIIDEAIVRAAAAVRDLMVSGVEFAMNKYNG